MNGVPSRLALAVAAALSLTPQIPAASETVAKAGPVTNLPLPRYVSMRAREANARRGPSLANRVDWTFRRKGLPLEVTAEYGQWRRVRDADGAGGWVHQSLLSGVRTGLVVGDGQVRLQAGASERTALRAMVEPGVVVRLLECDGEWCDVSTDGIDGWMAENVLWGVDPGEILD